jgi:alkanesulfonate monooxygenase SsuD/methylene tetrahydromethanopterin reductase-like flavin-dependent oxidoreductase (luciferase family)
VVYAKQLVTLDNLSKGRAGIGIGVGWLREEFDACQVSWDRRGKRTDEYIEAMRALWRDDPATYQGEFVKFQKLSMTPKPVGKITIVVGGHGEAAARRAGRLGDGFFPAIFPNSALKEKLPALIKVMRDAAVTAGRDPNAIEVTSGGTRHADQLGWFRDVGVHRMVIRVRGRDPKEIRDEILRFGDEVIAKS